MTVSQQLALPLAAALGLAGATLVAPALARPQVETPSNEIVVTGSPREAALTSWSKGVQAKLEDSMRLPRLRGAELDLQGLTEVRFVCGRDGRPDQVALAKSSGSRRIDEAALAAIHRTPSLHPLPEGMKSDQAFLAQLMFLDGFVGDRENARRVKAMQTAAAKHNAWFYRDQIASGELMLLAAAR